MKNSVKKVNAKGLNFHLKLTQTKKIKKVDTVIEWNSPKMLKLSSDNINYEGALFSEKMINLQNMLDIKKSIGNGFKLKDKFDINLSLDGKKWYTSQIVENSEFGKIEQDKNLCSLGESKSKEQDTRKRMNINRQKNIANTFAIALKNLSDGEKISMIKEAASEAVTTMITSAKQQQKLLK